MSEQIDNSPYTWEASQNAKGYFQIRFKSKREEIPVGENFITEQISKQLENIKKAVEKAGFKVQPEEPLKK